MSSFVRLSWGPLLALMIAGCSSTSAGSADGGPSDAATDAATQTDTGSDAGACKLPGTTGSQACDACLLAGCCQPFAACSADEECTKLNNCILDCDDGTLPDGGEFDPDGGATACANECAKEHPTGVNAFVTQQSCLVDKCASEDGGSTACSQ